MRGLLLLSTAGLLVSSSAVAEEISSAPTKRFALVVGNNLPLPDSDYEALQFADDDALRFAQFLQSLGTDVELLTLPDDATARRFPGLSNEARTPNKQEVFAAVDRLQSRLQSSKNPKEVYIYFSGHGSVSSSQSYLHLVDGALSRSELRTKVLDRLKADRTHVIIDSCHSYFMVNARGQRVRVEDDATLARYPRTGFVLSTASQKEVQEWAGYRGGVFSYQLLGAMQGAADVNLDGLVTYGEAHAYIVAANSGVKNAQARIQPFVRRPTVGERVLVDLRSSAWPPVNVPASVDGHWFVVDDRGHRVLDAHTESSTLALRLPPGLLWVNQEGQTLARVTEDPRAVELLAEGDAVQLASRGTIADEFRKNLFARPLTQDFVEGLEAVVLFVPYTPPAKREGWHPVSVGLVSGGSVAFLGGIAAAAVFAEAHSSANPEVFTAANARARVDADSRADAARTVMVSAFVSSAIMVGAGLLYELLDDAN